MNENDPWTTRRTSRFSIAREDAISRWERAFVVQALEESGGNVSAAARAVGLSRRYLHRLLVQHGLRGSGNVAKHVDAALPNGMYFTRGVER